eukprot:6485373-Amphidinium_carterae.1
MDIAKIAQPASDTSNLELGRASDVEPRCREVLCHRHCSLCVFGDIALRLPRGLAAFAQQQRQRYQGMLQEWVAKGNSALVARKAL